MKTPYEFYTLQWYPTPFYKEYFAYEKEISVLWWWQKIDISRGKISWPLLQAQSLHTDLQKICSRIPFVESLSLMWEVTFNPVKASYIDLWVVMSTWRFYIPFLLCSIYIYRLNIRRKRAKLIPLRISVSQSSHSMEIPVKWLQKDTVWIWYTLLHVVPIYAKFQNILNNLYTSNIWLQKYFPQFTWHYQIASWCSCLIGSSTFKNKLENLLSWYVWSFFNNVCFGIYKCRSYIDRNKMSKNYFANSYRELPTNLESLLVKRKTLSRK